MSDALRYRARRTLPAGDRYLAFLGVALLGYALMGKGFAYIGFPPLYVGEIAFLTGLAILIRSGAVVASLATLPSLVLATAMAWVLTRTVPFVSVYGFDALRDSVIIMYGGFAFIVIGLLLEDARRIETVLRYYAVLVATFPAMTVAFWLTKYWGDYIPKLFGSEVPIVEIGASAAGTHLAGTAAYVLIGYRKVSPSWIVVWIVTMAMIGATNRGAALSVVVPVAFAVIMLGRLHSMLKMLAAGFGIFCLLLAAEATFSQYEEANSQYEESKGSYDRPVSAHQILENVRSIFEESGSETEGTKRWRLDWWGVIVDDTFHGPNFWTGRGFGLNLAVADGFSETVDPGNPRPLTRSPHNAHMTVLARAGVPGVVLWSLVLISWGGMLLRAMLVARTRGHKQWADLFLWIICYVTAIVINATFDVALEGPMQGIWFWCLFGFGIGSAMVYRAQAADGVGSSG